jgi:voltage-gated potassium channel
MKRTLLISLLLFVGVTIFGTVGFALTEPTVHDAWESLYFTVVTMFTVGYGDIVPTTPISRLVAIVVVIGGVTAAITFLQSLFDLFLSADLRRDLGLPQRRTKMKDHIVICGYGNVGRQVYQMLKAKNEKFVIIELDQAKVADLVDKGLPVIQGDVLDEDVLQRANVEHAKAIIATTRDSTNIIVAINAKMLNPSIYVVSEVEDVRNIPALKKAGADEIVDCHEMGARIMVSKARKIVIDPVCGAEVNPQLTNYTANHEGAKYYFDSRECQTAFEKNPERFKELKRVVDATCGIEGP